MSKQTLLLLIAGLIAMFGGFSARTLVNTSSARAQQLPMPDFVLSDLAGQQRSGSEWKDKVRVINFWATWCPPCLKEMPLFNDMQKRYAAKNVQFIGIALDDAEPVKEFITAKKIQYPILLGGDQGVKLAHSMGNLVDTVPFTVIVDKKGEIVKTFMGEIESAELTGILDSLIR